MLTIFYLDQFDTLMSLDNSVKEYKTIKKEGYVLFESLEGKAIGFNIFDYKSKSKLDLKGGKVLYNKMEVIKEVNELLKTNFEYVAEFETVKVISFEEVKDSNILKLAKVSNGKEEFSLITNTTNLKVGLVSVVAKTWATLFDGTIIDAKTMIKGISSKHMFCSASTLRVSGFSDEGIIELPSSTPLGLDFAKSEFAKNVKL